jgi:hypothetical protein
MIPLTSVMLLLVPEYGITHCFGIDASRCIVLTE